MKNANGRFAAKAILIATPSPVIISKAAVTSMHRVAAIAIRCRTQLKNLKRPYTKTNLFYNKQNKMKVTTLAIAAFVLLLSACGNIDFKKTKGGMPYKIIAGKGGKS